MVSVSTVILLALRPLSKAHLAKSYMLKTPTMSSASVLYYFVISSSSLIVPQRCDSLVHTPLQIAGSTLSFDTVSRHGAYVFATAVSELYSTQPFLQELLPKGSSSID